jgi:hypothetical protein
MNIAWTLFPRSPTTSLMSACALAAWTAAPAFAQCVAPASVEPREQVVTEPRPRITWTAVTGADGYALSLQSRVPEGRLIGSYDVSVTNNEFIPPTALTDHKATVTLTVAARCRGNLGPPLTASFRINAADTCATPQKLTIANEAGKLRASWQAVAGAVHYEVKAHAPAGNSSLAFIEVREPRAELATDASAGTVVSVRPRCANAYGEPAFAVLAPQ